jgi:hypothetical protein
VKRETRFASRLPANEILSKIEAAAGPMGFNVQKRNYKVTNPKFHNLFLPFLSETINILMTLLWIGIS